MNTLYRISLTITLLVVALPGATAIPVSADQLAAHVGVTLQGENRPELASNLASYSAGGFPRALAAATTEQGRLQTTQAVSKRFPAEAATEALSRCERLRSLQTNMGPCELVHADDEWIETTTSLNAGIDEASKAPVWRIEGGKNTLWLAGSVHVLKRPFYPLPKAFDAAFKQADRLALELDPTRMEEIDRRMAMQSALTASPDQVKHALGEKRLAKLAPLLLRHGIDPQALLSLKPAIVATQITVAEIAALGYTPDQGIDLHYAQRAKAGQKVILELETVAEQMQALAGSPLDVQALMLDSTLEQLDSIQPTLGELLRAWLRADADALYTLMMADFKGVKPLEKLGRRILDDRNKIMHTKIKGWLSEEPSTFVIVGAGHLGGPNGLLTMLAADGFKVIPFARNGDDLLRSSTMPRNNMQTR